MTLHVPMSCGAQHKQHRYLHPEFQSFSLREVACQIEGAGLHPIRRGEQHLYHLVPNLQQYHRRLLLGCHVLLRYQ